MSAPRLAVIGSGLTAVSIAVDARRQGVADVRLLVPDRTTLPPDAPGRFGLSVSFGFKPKTIRHDRTGVVIENDDVSLRATVAIVVRSPERSMERLRVADEVAGRIHAGLGDLDVVERDVLVVGGDDVTVEDALAALDRNARVVVAFTGSVPQLSHLALATLTELEHSRTVTVLWQSTIDSISDANGHPMVHFVDRSTPDLVFDHVIARQGTGHDDGSPHQERRYVAHPGATRQHPRSGTGVLARVLDEHPGLRTRPSAPAATPVWEDSQLRARHYNATISGFEHSHEDLWVIRVRADRPDIRHVAGQYATLGLGYWEPRADEADEAIAESRRTRMIRRSYSISSRIFDADGYLTDPTDAREIEFYIVHVRPGVGRIPALTPRLALKRVGDRIYLGPKVTGRYTLQPVDDPSLDVVFLATGTGEAPHNAMIVDLLRRGHAGSILSVVTVRHLGDLGYLETHRRLEERFPNYRYLVVPTREETIEKRYIQDVVDSGELEAMLGHGFRPSRTHVFLCGNPAMIGLPEWEGSTPAFPERVGVAQLLHRRGFQLDRRGRPGNVHYEEYW